MEDLRMAIKVTESQEKVTPAKKNIKLDDILVSELRFVDETGDITDQVLKALPENVEKVSFKITVDLTDTNESEDNE